MKRLCYYIPTVIIATSIAYLSLLREVRFSLPHFTGWDKLVHFVMYFVLAAVMLWDGRRAKMLSRRMSFVVFAVCSLYGGVIEVLQEKYFYPRTGDWLDWIADCLGVVCGICVMLLLWKHRKKDATC